MTNPALPGIDLMGCIYDVTDLYANAKSVLTARQLFDLSSAGIASKDIVNADNPDDQKYDYPDVYTVTPLTQTQISETEATGSEDLQSKFSASLNVSGSYGPFSAEISANYSSECTESSEYWNVEKKAGVEWYKIEMPDYIDYNLYPYLAADFKAAIDAVSDSGSADALVATYGTHFLWSGIFGGEWKYTQSISKYSYSSKEAAEIEVDANYSAYAGSGSVGSSTDYATSADESDAAFSARGGLPSSVADGYDTWLETVPGNYALVEFDEDSLQPISKLAPDSTIEGYLEAAIEDALPSVSFAGKSLGFSAASSDLHTMYVGGHSGIEQQYDVVANRVVTGFAGRINGDGRFTRIAVKTLNLSNGSSGWTAIGDSTTFSSNNYELWGEVPDGEVLTGIGLTEHDHNLVHMVLHSQVLDPSGLGNSTNYLGNESLTETPADGGSLRTSYEKEFKPSPTAGLPIVGIAVSSGSTSIDTLRLTQATITSS